MTIYVLLTEQWGGRSEDYSLPAVSSVNLKTFDEYLSDQWQKQPAHHDDNKRQSHEHRVQPGHLFL